MLNKAIWNTQADDMPGVESCCVGRFEKGAAEASFQGPLLDGDHQRQILHGPEQRLLIQGLDETSVDNAKAEPFLAHRFGRLDTSWKQTAVSDEDSIIAPFEDFGLP